LFHSFGPLFIDRFSSTPEEKRKKRGIKNEKEKISFTHEHQENNSQPMGVNEYAGRSIRPYFQSEFRQPGTQPIRSGFDKVPEQEIKTIDIV